MIYRCPLCLEEIKADMQVVRYCVPDKHGETIAFDEDMLADDKFSHSLYCPIPDCKANRAASGVVDGVFLSHVGCDALNPFWNEEKGRVEIPGGENDGNHLKIGQMVIEHWEISLLREVKRSSYPGDKYKHMWFPLMLFRAMARPEGGRGNGSIIALVGGLQVGKTVLAMQAMDKQGYLQTGVIGRNVRVADYVFSRAVPGRESTSNPLFDTLYLRHLLYDDKLDLFRLEPSLREPGDLKVAFIEPSGGPGRDAPQGRDRSSENGQPVLGSLRSKVGNVAKKALDPRNVFRQIVFFLRIVSTFGPVEAKSPVVLPPPWHTAIFYDSSGEGAGWNDPIIREIVRCADRVAILVSAEEVFGAVGDEKTTTIRIAHARLDDLRKQGSDTRRCLVVTQLDKVLSQIGDDAQAIEKIAENLERREQTTREAELRLAREILSRWLNKKGYTTIKKKDFALDLTDFEEIFFLWTKNVPPLDSVQFKKALEEKSRDDKTADQATEAPWNGESTQPESYGLAKFVCWCLDIQWSDINKAR